MQMQSNKVKLLNNYQLYQLAQNNSLDEETLNKVHQELALRNISTIEQKQLEQQYQDTFAQAVEELETNAWNPLYTAFAWKRHFKYIALLKTFKRKKEAKTYQLKFYTGILIYVLLLILILFLLRK